MVPRTTQMTIQRRILAGYLAVAVLLLFPAVSLVIIEQVGERTWDSLLSGLDTIREITRLRTDFEASVLLSRALGDDPDVRATIESRLNSARATYAWLRPR